MFTTNSPRLIRKALLAVTLGLALSCAAAGGAAWHFTRCNMLDYLQRAAPSPLHSHERYLFACGYVWHSLDGGQLWKRIPTNGLPLGVRDGHIAVDRRRNYLYLGILLNTQSSRYCWQCAWIYLQPAIYTSVDGGHTWTFSYKFKRGPAGSAGFMALFVDPEWEGRAWAVIRNGDVITYYGTGTSGHFWKPACFEYYFIGANGCSLPDSVLQFQRESPLAGPAIGE